MPASQDAFERKIIQETVFELRRHPEINQIFEEYLDSPQSVDREYAYVLAGVKHTGQDMGMFASSMTRVQMVDDITGQPLDKPVLHCDPQGRKEDLMYDILMLVYGLKMEGMDLPNSATPEIVDARYSGAAHKVLSWLDDLETKTNMHDVSVPMKTPEEYKNIPSLDSLLGDKKLEGIDFGVIVGLSFRF